ncbi:MAG: calcium-binding protein [Cyanobacteria bacterium J06588_4]
MPIVGQDQRRVVDRFDVPGQITQAPLPSITAIDTRYQDETSAVAPDISALPGIGTGVVISPNYVLTAAHNLFVKSGIDEYYTDIRVTSSNQQKDLDGRAIGVMNRLDTGNVDLEVDSNVSPLDDPINTVPPGLFLPFVEKFLPEPANSRLESQVDIGLIEVNDRASILDAPPIGLIAFVDPLTLEDSPFAFEFRIQTAGYPADNVANSFPPRLDPNDPLPDNEGIPDRNDNDNSSIRPVTELGGLVNSLQVRGRDLVLAPGVLDANGNETTGRVLRASEGEGERRIQYSTNIDTIAGQSGSPVWGFLPEQYELEPIPRVFAVHSRGASAGNAANFGTLIDKVAYDLIIDEIEGDGDPNLLPENAIIGSNPRPSGVTPENDGNDLIEGTYRKELILGLTGNDTLIGGGADDRLEGNEGDDDLDGGTGDDILTGGPGIDLIDGGTNTLAIINPFNRESDIAVYSAPISEYNIEIDTTGGLFGSPIGGETVTTITHLNDGIDGVDILTNIEILVFSDGAVPLSSDDDDLDDLFNFIGTSGDDDIVGNVLGNLITGEGGNDRLDGDDGNDTLEGGRGNDLLLGGNDQDTLLGGNDLDRLFGNAGNDSLNGENGNDSLYGETGSDTLRGGNGNDYLSGGDNNDLVVGDDGNDNLRGELGNDRILGSEGNDSIKGGSGNDTVYAQADDDQIFGNDGNDFLSGDRGNDRILGNNGNDTIQGGSGNDTVYAQADDDRIFGNDGNDFLSGDRGNDRILGNNGNDTIQGGSGNDTVYAQAESDRIFGNDGDDLLSGDQGNDFIYGGTGNDTLVGGSGSDRFVYNTNRSFRADSIGRDTIKDFDDGDNRIILDKSTFDVIDSQAGLGFSRSSEFAVVSQDSLVASSDAFILYSMSTGNLFYNQNGAASGLGSGSLFATLQDAPAISAGDFQIVN